MPAIRGTLAGNTKMLHSLTIISGGQTGADRAALDWAIREGFPHGGYCPKGRLAEDGVIPAHYQLKETSSPLYPARTQENVRHATATVLFTRTGKMTRGCELTQKLAARHKKPLLHLTTRAADAPQKLAEFIRKHKVRSLNVAGSRASSAPEIGSFVAEVLSGAHQLLEGADVSWLNSRR